MGNERVTSWEHAERAVKELHESMSGRGANETAQAFARGVVHAFALAGLFGPADVARWQANLQACPGHDGGQVWCAYCGNVCRFCGARQPCDEPECWERQKAALEESGCRKSWSVWDRRHCLMLYTADQRGRHPHEHTYCSLCETFVLEAALRNEHAYCTNPATGLCHHAEMGEVAADWPTVPVVRALHHGRMLGLLPPEREQEPGAASVPESPGGNAEAE